MRKYEYLDLMKLISMVSVVLAHCMFFYASNPFWPMSAEVGSNVAKFLTNFFDYSLLAFFVFASGFVYNLSSQKKSAVELIDSRVKRLLMPWLLYGVFWLVPTYTYFDIESFGRPAGASLIDGYINMLLGRFADVAWFFPMLFWITLIWTFLKYFYKKERAVAGALVSVLVLILSHHLLVSVDFYKLSQIDKYILIFYFGIMTCNFAESIERLNTKAVTIIAVILLSLSVIGAQFANDNFYLGVLIRLVSAYAFLFVGLFCDKIGLVAFIKDKKGYKWLKANQINIYLFQVPWLYVYFRLLNPYVGNIPFLCITLNFVMTSITIFLVCQVLALLKSCKNKVFFRQFCLGVIYMKKIIKRYRNLSVIFQLVLVFSACISASIGINLYLGMRSNLQLYIDKMETDSRYLAHYAANEMDKSGNLDWLMHYWKENYSQMDFKYDDEEYILQKRNEFIRNNPSIDIETITTEELSILPADSRKLYAELEFMELVNLFDNLKRIYHPTYLFCCGKGGMNELFYYVTGTEEGELRGNTADTIYTLGSTSVFDEDIYPVAEKTFETGIEQFELEQPVKRGKDSGYYQVYVPLLSKNGDVLGLVGVTLESYTARNRIYESMIPSQAGSAILFLVSAVLLAVLVKYLLLEPVIDVQKNVKQYSVDKDSAKVVKTMKKLISKNEVGSLAEEISKMVVEIDRYTVEVSKLATEKERISAELNLAKTIQASYLPCVFPPFPDRKEFDIFATMDPAKEVGGDFYDFFLIDEDHLGLVIADVSGKGIPAALFMMISKTLIKNNAKHLTSPGEVLTMVNEQLCENNEAEMFVTVWIGILEISTGKMLCANAGHEYPAIRKNGGEFELYKDKHGLVLGGMDGIKYKEYELCLEPGDEIFVYTDGVPEATNSATELFGTKRMIDALNLDKSADVQALTTNVRIAIDEFVKDADQFDDITMLSFKYHGKQE